MHKILAMVPLPTQVAHSQPETVGREMRDRGRRDEEHLHAHPATERRGARRGHQAAVMDAEVRLLAHALAPWDIITRDALRRRVRAERWSQGGFEAALRAAIDQGVIEGLPGGFISLRQPNPRTG